MNCSICERKLNDYLEGRLSPDLSNEMKNHLEHCETCTEIYSGLQLVEKLIQKEKELVLSPFLDNKVMDLIRPKMTIEREVKFQRILQPLFIAASIMLALLGGIRVGNLYNSAKTDKQVPIELALMDDLSMESFNTITQK